MFLPADAEAAAKKAPKGKGPKKAKGAVKAGKVTKKELQRRVKSHRTKQLSQVSIFFGWGFSIFFGWGFALAEKDLEDQTVGFREGVPLTHIGTGGPNV